MDVPAVVFGRDGELSQLIGAMDQARAGRGSLVLVSGEPGVGKSKLCDRLARLAGDAEMAVAWASCWESAGVGPLWPWVQLLEQLGLELPSPAVDSADREVARMLRVSRVVDTIGMAARRRPCLLVFDDLQWADHASLSLLARFVPVVRAMPVLVVGTVRTPVAVDPVVVRLLVRRAETLHLEGLDAADLDALATVVCGQAQPGAGSALLRLTGGNPLFAVELLRTLHRQGRLHELGAVADPPVTPTVRAVLGERLSELTVPCRAALAAAAVVGQDASVALLAEVSVARQRHGTTFG